MLENVRLAFQGIWSHKMRSFLTMLGIIIGIAAIIAIVSTITGSNEQLKNKLVGSGSNTVKVSLCDSGGNQYDIYDSSSIPKGVPVVEQSVLDEICELNEVAEATAFNSRYVSEGIFYQNTSITELYVRGIDLNYLSTCNYVLSSGRAFCQEDYDNYRTVALLDETAAQGLFKEENPLGKTVEYSGTPFTVIGIVTASSKFAPEITSIDDYYMYANDSNGQFFIPKASWPIIFCYDEPENVIVKAVSTDDMTKAGQKSANVLNASLDTKEVKVKYKAEDLLGQVEELQELSNATNMQLIWIAGISLLVGGIGVMNITLVSVTERTSEIGLKKAIGARKSTILGQFLTEAAVLTSMGGMLGVAAGIGAAQVIHRISGVPVGISIPAAVIAVLFSMVIGIVFGFLPSVQAANLDPIEALRRE